MADAPIQTTHVRDVDMLEGAAVCCDITCACELVFGGPATEEQEARMWLWMCGPCERGQA